MRGARAPNAGKEQHARLGPRYLYGVFVPSTCTLEPAHRGCRRGTRGCVTVPVPMYPVPLLCTPDPARTPSFNGRANVSPSVPYTAQVPEYPLPPEFPWDSCSAPHVRRVPDPVRPRPDRSEAHHLPRSKVDRDDLVRPVERHVRVVRDRIEGDSLRSRLRCR